MLLLLKSLTGTTGTGRADVKGLVATSLQHVLSQSTHSTSILNIVETLMQLDVGKITYTYKYMARLPKLDILEKVTYDYS